MSQTRFQEFWTAGARFYFKPEDDADGTEHELIDLGVIEPVDPKVAPTALELYDSDGGIKGLVESSITFIDESYDIKCSNLNPDNLAFLFYAANPEAFTQAAAVADLSHYAIVGRLVKLKDSDGNYVYGLSAISGVYTGTPVPLVVKDIVVATKTISVTGDQTAVTGAAPGKTLIVKSTGLLNPANARSYVIVTRTFNTPNTDFVVAETPASDETAVTGAGIVVTTGTAYEQDTDWEVYSKDRGIVRMIGGGAFAADAAVQVVYSTAALTGNRLINPQTVANFVRGTGFLVYGRANNTKQSVREFICQIKPNGSTIGNEKYSQITLTVAVLRDSTTTPPAGRLLQFKGDLPDALS
jgi:hypothetical protein